MDELLYFPVSRVKPLSWHPSANPVAYAQVHAYVYVCVQLSLCVRTTIHTTFKANAGNHLLERLPNRIQWLPHSSLKQCQPGTCGCDRPQANAGSARRPRWGTAAAMAPIETEWLSAPPLPRAEDWSQTEPQRSIRMTLGRSAEPGQVQTHVGERCEKPRCEQQTSSLWSWSV